MTDLVVFGTNWITQLPASYPYAQVERAWAITAQLDDRARTGSLRGLIKRLSTLDIPMTAGPGRGARRAWSTDDIEQVLLAVELEQFGLDPTMAAGIIHKYWNVLQKAFRLMDRATSDDDDVFLYVKPACVTDRQTADGLPIIGIFRRFDFELVDGKKTRVDVFAKMLLSKLSEEQPRLSIVNLSLQKRRFDAALAKASEAERERA